MQRPGERPAEAGIRPGLHLSGAPSAVQRLGPQRIEQHRLAYSAQPGEDEASFRSTPLHTLQSDIERAQLSVSTRQLRWSLTGSRRVRIANRVHVSDRISAYSAFLRFR